MVIIEGFRGSSGGGGMGSGGMSGGGMSGGGMSGGGDNYHNQSSQMVHSGRPISTGFQHNLPTNNNWDRRHDGNNIHHVNHANNNIINFDRGGDGYNHHRYNNRYDNWYGGNNGYYPPFVYNNSILDRLPADITINEKSEKPKKSKNKNMDETIKILLIVFVCIFAIIAIILLMHSLKK
jgi:hypothetical protein